MVVMRRILVIEDDPTARSAARDALRARGHDVVTADTAAALVLLGQRGFDLVVAGLEPLPPEAHTLDEDRRPAMHHELVCLPHPLAAGDLVAAIEELEARVTVRHTLDDACRALGEHPESPIVGTSPAMRRVLVRTAAVATSDAPVLLTGESGTGKELLARAIHDQSPRRGRPLVAVNCAAFPENLIEAELFGHVRGAFTGAIASREGCFKAADGGTLFLDEVNSLSPPAQAKLLRVAQNGTFNPVGSDTPITVDVRLVSATNTDLRVQVDRGLFREDLYYRIKVLDLEVPPLRERIGDLPLLVAYFLLKFAPVGRRPSLSPRAWAALTHHAFPGNVRELEHAIQHAIVLACGSEIGLEHLPREISAAWLPAAATTGEIRPLWEAVRDFEEEYVARALERAHGNKTVAARMLGVSRKHLWEKLRRFETKPRGKA